MSWNNDGNEMITLVFDELKHTTPDAFLLIFGDEKAWIPKSQSAKIDLKVKTIDVKRWLVEEKELENYEE